MTATFDEKLERQLKTIGLWAGPLLAATVWLINPGSHNPEARGLLAVVTLAVCYWMTEAIPLPATAILASGLAILIGVAPARTVFAPYADPVIFLFIGSFLLSEAFGKYGLDRRIAAAMLSTRLGRSGGGLMAGFGGASAAISTCLSNTATAALMTPIAVGTMAPGVAEEERRRRATALASGVLLMVAYGASTGGMATIIGTPPNLLVAGFIERMVHVKVTFTGWLLFGTPIALVLLVASLGWTRLVLGGSRDETALPHRIGAEAARVPDDAPTRRGARLTMAAFGLAGLLWTVPALVSVGLGSQHPVTTAITARLPEAGVAILCAGLLFIAPIDWPRRRFALSWKEGQQVNWGIILLFGGGLSLGTLAESTGIARWVGEGIASLGIASTPAGLLAVSILVAIFVSEFASNTASATLLVPVVIAAAQAAGFDPVRPALGVGLAATCGFIFPVSTPPNAIVFGTGLVPLWRMIKVGILLDLTSFIVIWLGLLALTPLLPHAAP